MKKENKKSFQELWNDKRSHALIVLGMWGIFLVGMFVFLFIADSLAPKRKPVPKNSSTEVFVDFSVMKEALLKDNYAYTYEVNQNGQTIIFKGKKNGEKEVGYQETIEKITKYEKENGIMYQTLLDQKVEITNLYEGLYEDFLNSKKILEQISLLRKTESKENNYKVYTYEATDAENTYQIKIVMDQKNIVQIVINHPVGTYTMKFTNIGKITDQNLYE